MNRVFDAIQRMEKQIADRLATGQTTKSAIDKLHKTLDMSFDEYCKFQELKSLAVANEKITLDEGQYIYMMLGNIPDHFNNQPIAVKVVLTKIYEELLRARIVTKV